MEDTRFILEEAEKEEIKHQQKNRNDKKTRRDKNNQSRQVGKEVAIKPIPCNDIMLLSSIKFQFAILCLFQLSD